MAKERAPKGGKPRAPAYVEHSRDMYGFMVRPQHLERYREYCPIYKEEEAERSERWDQFLSTINETVPSPVGLDTVSSVSSDGSNGQVNGQDLDNDEKESTPRPDKIMIEAEPGATKLWGQLRKSLWAIERAGSIRHRGINSQSSFAKECLARNGNVTSAGPELTGTTGENRKSDGPVDSVKEAIHMNGHAKEEISTTDTSHDTSNGDSGRVSPEGSGDDSEDEFCDATESTDVLHDVDNVARFASSPASSVASPPETSRNDCPWDEELRSLVRGGVPMALRGELWQVFVGTKKRRAYGHYNALLTLLADGGGDSDGVGGLLDGSSSAASNYLVSKSGVLEKWTNQIEKDLPRTFPGHPALDEDGRNALRRLLTAYARHNPSVGYCQAMNFLAALLLLLMPEENAFWTLTGIIDDYFEGYYSEKMLEAQVDQLVFEDLVREHFPKLVSHLDTLQVQVAWVSGPWFLSIFVNVLPWESVLRVWDVLLFEGNRCMLFRTALALMEMHAPALTATRDAGDAVALLQSMASATFDSSQLVLIACMGFQTVTEPRLQKLRVKHRPDVLAALQERSIELHLWRNSNAAMTSKLPYLYTKPVSGGDSLLIKKTIIVSEDKANGAPLKTPQTPAAIDAQRLGLTIKLPVSFEETSVKRSLTNVSNPGSDEEDEMNGSDLQEQVKWLKNEISRALEDRKAATVRAEQLETALVEMVQQDNRLFLAAKVEKLEAEVTDLRTEVAELKSTLAQKEEHEASLVQVLVRMEQEQRIADDARRFAEQDSAAQKLAAEMIEAKYEASLEAMKEMEKRAVMAETILEATLSYQALGNNSPHGSFRRSSMDPLLVRPPESPVGSPIVESSMSKNVYNATNGSIREEHLDEKASKQGIFSRPFALSWRDRSKSKTAASIDSPRSVESPRTPFVAHSERGFDANSSLPSSEASSPDSAQTSSSVHHLQRVNGSSDGKMNLDKS
ncbi:hypothetical protein Mapa_006757 [Marchantia paleacea]|nr:hypothetical protein Mapa_006757 [Marchantia paleacea]